MQSRLGRGRHEGPIRGQLVYLESHSAREQHSGSVHQSRTEDTSVAPWFVPTLHYWLAARVRTRPKQCRSCCRLRTYCVRYTGLRQTGHGSRKMHAMMINGRNQARDRHRHLLRCSVLRSAYAGPTANGLRTFVGRAPAINIQHLSGGSSSKSWGASF